MGELGGGLWEGGFFCEEAGLLGGLPEEVLGGDLGEEELAGEGAPFGEVFWVGEGLHGGRKILNSRWRNSKQILNGKF